MEPHDLGVYSILTFWSRWRWGESRVGSAVERLLLKEAVIVEVVDFVVAPTDEVGSHWQIGRVCWLHLHQIRRILWVAGTGSCLHPVLKFEVPSRLSRT